MREGVASRRSGALARGDCRALRSVASHDQALFGTAAPTGCATSEPKGGESSEKLAKTTEMCLPERKRVRKGGEEDDRSCRPHPGRPDGLAQHAVLVWGSRRGGACAPAIRGPGRHPGARALCARPDGQV